MKFLTPVWPPFSTPSVSLTIWLESAGTPSIHFEITVVGVRRRVHTSQGLSVPVVSAAQLPRPDIVLIPALGAKMPATLQAALERRDVADAGKLLRQWSDGGALVSAACTGTFVLANTSLLDGQSATTSWWLAPLFRERYPRSCWKNRAWSWVHPVLSPQGRHWHISIWRYG